MEVKTKTQAEALARVLEEIEPPCTIQTVNLAGMIVVWVDNGSLLKSHTITPAGSVV